MKSDAIYYATIGWDGIDEYTQGDRTITRMNIADLIEGVQDYLHTFESRLSYLACASVEYRDGRKTVESKDLTETIKTVIKKENNETHGK